jgi:hypothetical protein
MMTLDAIINAQVVLWMVVVVVHAMVRMLCPFIKLHAQVLAGDSAAGAVSHRTGGGDEGLEVHAFIVRRLAIGRSRTAAVLTTYMFRQCRFTTETEVSAILNCIPLLAITNLTDIRTLAGMNPSMARKR